MKLRELTCTGVRGLADRTYSFADPRTSAPLPVVLVTGAAASGKTSLLEAIAAAKEVVGNSGPPRDPKRLLRPGAREARITATWVLSPAECDRARVDKAEHAVTWELGTLRTDADPGLRRLFAERGKLGYLPASRQLPSEPRSVFGAPGKSADLLEGLRALAVEDAARAAQAMREMGIAIRSAVPDALAPYKAAVAAMLPDLRLHGFDLGEDGGLRFMRRTREIVGLDALSDSERQGVLFALAFRWLGLDGSLVLVDEPELHIHAAQRAPMLRALVGLGKDNQIIVATGSAELVREAAPGQVIDLSRGG